MTDKSQRYLLLDGMRGIAAIVVMIMHFAWQVGLQEVIFPHAYLAVDFFFMLSGFVVAQAYEGRLASGSMGFLTFCKLRLIRLYPMILLGTLIGVAAALSLIGAGWLAAPPQWTLVAGLANLAVIPWVPSAADGSMKFGFPLNNPIWSLFWELLANAAAAVWIIRTRPGDRQMLILTMLCAAILIGFALTHNGVARGDREWAGGLVRVAYAFNCGMLLHRMRDRLTMISFPMTFQLIALVAILACPMIPHVNALYDIGIVLVVFPLIIAAAWKAHPVGRMLPLCVALGEVSYPLYALHYPFVEFLKAGYQSHHWPLAITLSILLAIGLVATVASYVVAIWVDAPVRRWLHDRTARTRPRRPAVEPG